jgi:hypothetical protein
MSAEGTRREPMTKDIVPTPEERVALVNEAKERMTGRARSWLEDSKVKAALSQFKPEDGDVREAS